MGDSLHVGIEMRLVQFTGGGPFDGGDSDGVHCKPSVRLADRALPCIAQIVHRFHSQELFHL